MALREDLRCEVKGVHCDFERHVGTLMMSPGHCADMDGCISLFQAIDPDILTIRTFAGFVPDAVYVRSKGRWTIEARVLH